MAHYELDVQPELVRAVRRTYRSIARSLEEEAAAVEKTPGTIGDDWTGRASRTVKHDITALGKLLSKFHDHYDRAADALKALADTYDDELVALGKLNTRRTEATSVYDSSVSDLAARQGKEIKDLGADRRAAPDEVTTITKKFNGLRTAAAQTRDSAYSRIDSDHEALVERARTATRTCARTLAHATHVKVPQSLAVNLLDPSNYAAVLAALRDACAQELGTELELVAAHDAADDADKTRDADQLEELLSLASMGDVDSTTELLALLRRYEGDPEFAALLASELEPKDLGRWLAQMSDFPRRYGVPEGTTEAQMTEEYLELLGLIGGSYGLATQLQGDNAMPRSRYDDFTEAITDQIELGNGAEEWPGQHIVLSSLLTQGSWHPDFLATVTKNVVDFERENLQGTRWSEYNYDSWSVMTPQGYSSDPVQTLMVALANNRAAAQQFFTDGGTRSVDVDGSPQQVSDTLAYLLIDRRTNDEGTSVAAALSVALAEFPGDDVPAELARQLQAIVDHGEEQVARAKAEAEKNKKPWYVDVGHFVLDLAGLLPLVGEVADLVNAGWYSAEGDMVNAGLSAAGAIPFVGWASTGAKGLKGVKAMMSPADFAKMEKHLEALQEAGADLTHGVRRGQDTVLVEFGSAQDLGKVLDDLIPNAVYKNGDLVFRTDGAGKIVVEGTGGMRRFMEIGRHAKPGTELSWAGHSFKVAADGTVDVIAVSRYKPIWGQGEAFNAANWRRYPHNEIYLENGKRLDSYRPPSEIVERKFRQYADLKDATTLRKDVDLITRQYPPGTKIPDTPGNRQNFPELVGEPLMGKMVLEIPPQNGPLDPKVLRYAATRGVTVRDTAGKVYSARHPNGKVGP